MLNPDDIYPTLNLRWPIEKYVHEIGINVMMPNYVITGLYLNDKFLKDPNYLYKFYSPENHNFESLESPYLYFGDPEQFNDSFDCIVSENEYIQKFLDKEYLENIGICNFSTEKTKKMWTFYTNKNQGFAVKYKNDNNFIPYSDKVAIRSHVLYLKENIPDHPNLIEALKSIEGKHFPEPVKGWQHQVLMQHDLCRKDKKDFQWESEYRMITFKREEINRRIEINPSAIDSVYIGHRMSAENQKRLLNILKKYGHVKVFKIKPNPKTQKFEEVRIKNIT